MSQIEINHVRGFCTGDKTYCWECVEFTDFTLDEYLLDANMKPDYLYFCDKCKKLL